MRMFVRTNIPQKIQVTVSVSNVRSGPSTSFIIVGKAYKGEIIDCIGKINSWWVVHMENDTVGLIYGPNATPYNLSRSNPQSSSAAQHNSPSLQSTSNTAPSADQIEMLDLINTRRAKEGLKPLAFDETLQQVAKARSEKMVTSGVLSHQLPDLGSPQDTMNQFNVDYKTGGENFAGYPTVAGAESLIENHPPHLRNILDGNFNFIGIGIADSPQYGKVFVQDFVGR